jgi:hypothetical protein
VSLATLQWLVLTCPSFTEPFHVVLEISNPLDTELRLGRLTVGGDWQSSPSSAPKVAVIDEIVMEPRETREVLPPPLPLSALSAAPADALTTDALSSGTGRYPSASSLRPKLGR